MESQMILAVLPIYVQEREDGEILNGCQGTETGTKAGFTVLTLGP